MKNYAKPGEVMYHVGLSKEMLQGAKYALVPGDPGRVEGLAKAVDPGAVYLASHREFTSWLARVKGEPVLVMSSGMGGPCITFVVEELGRLGVTTFIRVGTTGSLQESLNLGDVVISKAAVRMDGAGRAYAPIEYPAVADLDVTVALRAGAICGVVAKRTDSEAVAPPEVYRVAEKRFQAVAKRALEKLIEADKA